MGFEERFQDKYIGFLWKVGLVRKEVFYRFHQFHGNVFGKLSLLVVILDSAFKVRGR
jgi:hypothetical protein